ncbi:hypothetical protein HWV62_33301 [Athelia sp. TMB]|nr:hypothetical protein HWV62_33301 [Athelia sp. TMB]
MATPLACYEEETRIVVARASAVWTLAERVMMDPRNEDAAEGILDRISMADAMALGATCRRARTTWLHYVGKVFNLNRFLTHYAPDAPAFRQMMEATSSVITGRSVTEMLKRNNPGKHPLVLVTGPVQASVVRRHLEEEQGYRAFGENQYWMETRGIGKYARVRGIRPSKVNLRSVFLSRKATTRREFLIKQMLTLSRITGSGRIRYVILQVPRTCVSKTVMSAGTITFYPRVTYLLERNFRIHHPASARRWRLAIPLERAFFQCASAELEGDDYKLLKVREGQNAIRYIGDSDCWMLMYDEGGNYTAEISSAAYAKKKDDLEGNGWSMRVDDGRISHRIEAARLSDFDPNL